MRLSVERVDYSYERVLASLGRYVDQHSGNRIRIVEGDERFELEYRAGIEPNAAEHVDFELDSLPDVPSDGPGSGGYGDFLTALGRELDFVSARQVAIKDVDQGLVVTYWYEHPTADYVSQFREFALGPDERRELVKVQQRRQQLSIAR